MPMSAPKPRVLVQKSDIVNRITHATDLPAVDRQRFREIILADRLDFVFANDPDTLDREIGDATYLLTENGPLDARLINKGLKLKLIQNGGLRHRDIDLATASAAGIPVAVFAQPGDISVAEHALMLMMALGKKLLLADRAARRGEGRSQLAPHVTSQGLNPLYGKTLGIVGMGEIGLHVARRARVFEMRVLYFNRKRYRSDEEEKLGLEYRPLAELMAQSDIVDIHLALVPETSGLIGARELAAMKPSALLINTARGAIVDEAALVRALVEGRIAGAGLDVFASEPLSGSHPLSGLDNVILTPHVSGRGVAWDSLTALFGNIRRSLNGEPLQGVINQLTRGTAS